MKILIKNSSKLFVEILEKIEFLVKIWLKILVKNLDRNLVEIWSKIVVEILQSKTKYWSNIVVKTASYAVFNAVMAKNPFF